MRLWRLTLFSCIYFATAQSQTGTHLLVTIESGMLRGAHFGPVQDEAMFLGIPFAAPPTAERRWKPPQPIKKWQGVRKADSYGAACPQAVDQKWMQAYTKEIVETFEPYYTFHTDEDCLYLN